MSDSLVPQLSLGEKVRNFRKRAGLSQLELETAITASPGSVSRIEAGKVNPTKETILDISSALKLPPTERFYLLDTQYDQISDEDTTLVIKALHDILEGDELLGYVIDDKYNIVAISKNFRGLLSQLHAGADKLVNKNMVEIVFNPELGIRNAIDKDNFEFVAINLLSFFNQELSYRLHEPWWKELYERVEKLPDFQAIWKKTKAQTINGYSPISRTVKFNFGGVSLDASYSLTAVHFDPRFTIAEYTVST